VNCETARDLLSSFYDRELPPDQERQMRAHIGGCRECARRLAEFEELSQLTARLREPRAPAEAWTAIASALEADELRRARFSAPTKRLALRSRAAIAATIVVAASIGLASYWLWQQFEPHAAMAAAFDTYLAEFQTAPRQAQHILIDRYEGQRVDPARADLPFSANAPAELPDGYARQETFVLKMPCCVCTQTIYKNPSGAVVALFEHSEKEPGWFGNRPAIHARCHGTPTSLVQVADRLAATWKCGPRYLTIVGAQNVEQVAQIVAVLSRPS
jgi:hypothetical protein